MIWYFLFFFISGFCSVLYELVWLRLAMAQFGVTAAMVSIVLSVFMAGLGIGSWVSGIWLRRERAGSSPLRLYGLLEFLIGVSGLVVPYELTLGRRVLEQSSLNSSLGFYAVAGIWVALTLLPWTTLMGATVPVAMSAIRETLAASQSSRSFSFLYMANVTGAIAGTTIPLFLIELFGFRGTLRIGVVCNLTIAISAVTLAAKSRSVTAGVGSSQEERATPARGGRSILALLFLSGLTSMAMEVVWVRCYSPYFGTVVYAFASILGVYLISTLLGSITYRRWSARKSEEHPLVWSALATSALLPLVAASPMIHMARDPRLLLGVMPFTGLLGFVTPMLVDRFSAGNPTKAGRAYAINIVGCILGPLVAGFGLLPLVSERRVLILLTIPWVLVGAAPLFRETSRRWALRPAIFGFLVLDVVLIAVGKDYEQKFAERRVLRDPTATVIATGSGMKKQLLVNGYGMTNLTTITKVMAHFPLAFLDRPPKDALVICFGMGTTFRALHTWGIPVTAAELVPSVPRMFDYYHSDGLSVLESPLSHVVIDDGRRFLERATVQFDLITVDPPPPVQAAGSSLLYSEEFYELAKRRLRPGGILQQWLPMVDVDRAAVAAVARSVRSSFPYVRVFWDEFGVHFLCSDHALPLRSADDLLQRLPPAAASDLVEWPDSEGDQSTAARRRFEALLDHELTLDRLIAADPAAPALTDDRPVNEYYILRHWFERNPTVGHGEYP
jgi:spermidine synthase